MRKFKRILSAISVMLVSFLGVGCAELDLNVEIQKNGSASMSYQIVLAEELYNALVEYESESGSESSIDTEINTESNDSNSAETSVDINSSSGKIAENTYAIDLRDYVKEEVDGKVRYVYAETRKDYASYNDLNNDLIKIEILPGLPLFDTITITSANNENFTFHIKTMEITTEMLKSVTSIDAIPDEWLTFNMAVTMPGEIDSNKYSEGVKAEMVGENSVRFTICDFAKPQSISLHSLLENTTPVPFIIVCAVTACIAIILISSLAGSKNRDKENKKDE